MLILAALLLSISAVSRTARAQTVKWTFMVYLDADNDLEAYGIDNFLAMAKVGSTDDVKIVVQFDRIRGYNDSFGDWSTAKRFVVAKGMVPNPANATQDLGEANMADPATLVSFVTWAAQNYQADHYFLDIWDHGLGWQGVALDEEPPGSGVMSAVQLGSALEQIKAMLGRPLDIIANDACRMTLEIMYQARQFATYFVGSEKDEPVEGWPYDAVLGPLVAQPMMTPVELARTLVDKYVESYSPPNVSSYSVEMALVDSAALPAMVAALNDLVSAVNFTLPYYERSVARARNLTEHYESTQCWDRTNGNDYDLYDIATNLALEVANGRVITAGASLQAAIRRAVLYERHINITDAVNCVWADKAHGLALWYPWGMGTKQADYQELALSQDSLWDEYLLTFRQEATKSVGLTTSLRLEDSDHDDINDTAAVSSVSSELGTVFIDVFLDGSPTSTASYDSPAATDIHVDITLPSPGYYDFFVLFRQSGEALNATTYVNVPVNATLLIKGVVRSDTGEPIDGAIVTIRNVRSNESLSTTTVNGIYAFNLRYPQWLKQGDNITLEVRSDTSVGRASFTLDYRGQRFIWMDLFLENGDSDGSKGFLFGPYWPIIVIPSVAIVVEAVALVLIRSRRRNHRK